MIKILNHKQLILLDGVGNLWYSTVQWVIKHDNKDIFMFTALQSEVGQQIIKEYNIDTNKTDSILLFTAKHGFDCKSTAALKIACQLGFPNNLMCVFFIIPPLIRNWVYDFIAKNRYKWYGKKESCMIPTPELKKKFLE